MHKTAPFVSIKSILLGYEKIPRKLNSFLTIKEEDSIQSERLKFLILLAHLAFSYSIRKHC